MKKIFFLVTSVVLVFATAMAQQKETPPVGGKAKDFKLSDKKTATYANGLKSTLVHYGDLPKVTVSLIIKPGTAHENTDQVWLADLTCRLLREGTSTLNF